MTLLGLGSSPPNIAISQVPQLEDGMKVQVEGILVDLWRFETGTESLILSEPGRCETLKVISSMGRRPQPSLFANLGDELHVLGELSSSGTEATLFTTSDFISVTRKSEDIVTVDILRDNWMLFEGDSVRLRGILVYDEMGAQSRLYNVGMNCSIMAVMGRLDAGKFAGSPVIVTGTLSFNSQSLSLQILVSSVMVDP